MATERDSQAELEREIAALIRERLPEAAGCEIAVDIIENNVGAPGEMRIKFTPSAGGEPSPLIYPEEVDEETMRRAFDFKRETIRGKPLSQTVIEDRGPEMPDNKPDPTKRQPWHPEGEPSPIIYPPEEVDEETMRRAFDFEPETIRGKPLSETVIEDRGPEMPDNKPDPTKRQPRRPEGEPSPPIYPEGGEESLIWRESDFAPVKSRGKSLSETVIEDRRAGW